MKKLKATDEIIVRNKNMNGVTLTYIKNEYGTYTTTEKLGLLKLQLIMSLDDIQRYIDWGLFELVKGEYEEDEELKEVKREDENKVSEIKNNISENNKVEDKKDEVINGLNILNDIYNNGEKSKYYNCKLKFVGQDKFFRIIENGVIYINNSRIRLNQSDMLYFMNSKFTLVKEEKEVTWQEAIEILTNQSDKYDVYVTDNNGNGKYIVQKHNFIELRRIVKNKWYVVEK